MRVVQFDLYGPPDVLHVANVDAPSPNADQVQIRVAAASVNPADFKWRSGALRKFAELQLPHVVGYDVAGTVTAVGSAVTAFKIGDRVAASLPKAGYAEIAVAEVASSAHVPAGCDLATAAALPCAALTGVQMIEDCIKPRKGQIVLVTGATGAVGRFALFAALAAGARVVAAVRPTYFDEARKLGAHDVIPLEGGDKPGLVFDHIADTVGGPAVAALCKHTARDGIICTVSTTPIDPAGLPSAPKFYGYHHDGARLEKLMNDVVAGKVSMPVARRLPFASAAEAHRLMESGGLGGKIVLEP